MKALTLTLILMTLILTPAGCGRKTPLVFKTDFEDGSLDAWQPTDPKAWRIEQGNDGKVLSLFGKSNYQPPVRSPLNINLIKDVVVGSFVMELQMHSTTRDYGHRDLCLFFGHRDPSHFYYVHIANQSDPHANSIFLVNGEPRVSIAGTRTEGTKWDQSWHVFFDDKTEPIMTAEDDHFKSGRIGVGSFDDTGQFDNISIRGKRQ